MSENQYRHKWKYTGCHPHNGEYWHECEICGKKDWVPYYSDIDESIPFGCIPTQTEEQPEAVNVVVSSEKDPESLYKALKYVIEDLEIRSHWKRGDQNGVVDIGHSAYIQAKDVLSKWEKS